jgi:hypothetical protein
MDRPEARVALIEWLSRDGHVQSCVDVWRWPAAIGRALDNTMVLDDPHVAPHHLRLDVGVDGGVTLAVGDTRNGVRLGDRWLAAGAVAPLPTGGANLIVGACRLRIRLPGEALAAEQKLVRVAQRPAWTNGALLAAVFALLGADHWIALDPGDPFTAWLPLLLGAPAVLLGWCAVWALASKVFQHRFDFWGHLGIVLPFALAFLLVDALLPQVAASLGWPWLANASALIQAALAVTLLWSQARHVIPNHPRALGAATIGVAAVLAALSVVTSLRSTDRWGGELYLSSLPLPALRWGRTVTSQAFIDSAAGLRAGLQSRVQRARDDDADTEDTASP